MSDPDARDVPEVAPHEESASALLDGEATPDEQASANEPDVARALIAHGEVARRVGVPVDPPPAAARERAIAAALAAFDRGETDAPAAAPDELTARRARRQTPAWLAAVAAALVLLAGIGLFTGLAGGGDDDESTDLASATTAAEAAGEADAATEAAPGAGIAEESSEFNDSASGEAPTAAAPVPFLGDFPDVDALAGVALSELAARQAASSTTAGLDVADSAGPLAVPCGSTIGPVPDAVLVGTATVAGELVTVVVHTAPDGDRSVVVYADPVCEPTPVEP